MTPLPDEQFAVAKHKESKQQPRPPYNPSNDFRSFGIKVWKHDCRK